MVVYCIYVMAVYIIAVFLCWMDDGCVLYLCSGSVYNSSISVMDG